ncbi:MAG: PrgI family protein [Patescibacteria group bacterium]
MRFQVPQFIEVKDKIIGPLTLKQFLYLIGGGAAIFLLYISLPFFLFVILAAPIAGFSAALAFYKVNEKPFITVVENALRYFTQKKTYTWSKREKSIRRSLDTSSQQKKSKEELPVLTKGKLDDLAWSLDIKRELGQKP